MRTHKKDQYASHGHIYYSPEITYNYRGYSIIQQMCVYVCLNKYVACLNEVPTYTYGRVTKHCGFCIESLPITDVTHLLGWVVSCMRVQWSAVIKCEAIVYRGFISVATIIIITFSQHRPEMSPAISDLPGSPVHFKCKLSSMPYSNTTHPPFLPPPPRV